LSGLDYAFAGVCSEIPEQWPELKYVAINKSLDVLSEYIIDAS